VVPAETPATGDGASPAGDGANATDGANANTEVTVVPPILPMPAPPTTRRKRKAKGWFCPVCRQPYTAMLRITTVAPMPQAKEIDNRLSVASASEDDGRPSEDAVPPSPEQALPLPVTTAQPSRGLGIGRPGFMRHFSRGSLRQQAADTAAQTDSAAASPPASAVPNSAMPMLSLPPDLERGQAVPDAAEA